MIATVELANGFKFPGSACCDQGEAVESAASVALFQLVRTSLVVFQDNDRKKKRKKYENVKRDVEYN